MNSNNNNEQQSFRIESNAPGFSIRIYRDGVAKDADLPAYIPTPLDIPEVLPEVVAWVKGNVGRSLEIAIPITPELLARLAAMEGNAELVWHMQHTDNELHPVNYTWQAVKKL